MSNLTVKASLGVMLFIASALIGFAVFFCASSCQASPFASTPATIEAVAQARALQKKGELKQAIDLFELHAAEGSPTAMFHAGKAYSRGWGVKPDLVKAEHYFVSAIQFDFPQRGEAVYEMGRVFQRSIGPDCDTLAVEWFEKALGWQFVKASMQLAIHYEKGRGVDQDIGKAIKNFEIATHAGYAQALLKYAYILIEGRYDIAPNPQRAELMIARAMETLERKARTGSASAAKQLGRIYRKGNLVPVDLAKAEKWLLQSARSGSTGGMHDIARLILAQKDSARQMEALDWLRAAAKRGHGGAMTTLGRLHLAEKYGLLRPEALTWFEMGIEAGHGGAMEEMAELYTQGLLVEKDITRAIELAQTGSDIGHAGCARLLAILLDNKTARQSETASATKQ